MTESLLNADNVNIFGILRAQFFKRVLDRGTKHVEVYNKESYLSLEIALKLLEPTQITTSKNQVCWTGVIEDAEFYVEYHPAEKNYNLIVFTHNREEARFQSFVEENFPQEVNDKDVQIKFWNMDSYGNPSSYSKWIQVNQWDNIAKNYPPKVSEKLENLVNLRCTEEGGKIVLLHGSPGTGKTHMIRALADAWRDWCDVEYVVDPEQLFGKANYMINSLIFDNDEEFYEYSVTGPIAKRKEPRWRLVVVEDAGEFIRADAKNEVGQGLARLLNLSDGIIGQGLRLIILITTNDQIGDLHPAMTRPGRCLATIGFEKFTTSEAEEWLRERETVMPPFPATAKTLAELYEMKDETQIMTKIEEYSGGQYL